MTEAEEPKERPPRVLSPSLSLFSPPPLTALPGIDVPYGDLRTDFQISSRSGTQSIRLPDAVAYALTSVIWPRGRTVTSQDVRAVRRRARPREENHYGPLEYNYNPASSD